MDTSEDILEKNFAETNVQIKNADGLHMRPAMQFVDIASKYPCEVKVDNGETEVDGKSIMQMSMLAATCGSILKITTNGPNADEALKALKELVEVRKFDEE